MLAAAATPFELDDYYLLASVSEPAFSPAGDRIAYTVSRNDKKSDKSTSDIWSVPWSGGKPAQLTRTPKSSESQPRYSSDGKSLFFLSDAGKDDDDDEDEVTQLWRMSAKGGGARKVTDIHAAASATSTSRPMANAPSWSPKSGCASAARPKTRRRSKSIAFCSSCDGEGYLDDRTQQLFIVDLATGKARQLTSGQRDHWHPVWSPDGTSLAYTAKERGETDRDSNYEVFVQRVDAGEPKKISHVRRTRQRSGLGRASRLVAGFAPRVWLEGGETSGSTMRRRSSRWPMSPPARSRARRASIAGSTIPGSRPTARYSPWSSRTATPGWRASMRTARSNT